MIQGAICVWAVAVSIWYFYQFSPVISPILKRFLQKIWNWSTQPKQGLEVYQPLGHRYGGPALHNRRSSVGDVWLETGRRSSLGIVSKVSYLEEGCPDYQATQAINGVLDSLTKTGKTLLFLRHTYYLHVSFLNGDPTSSWMINPDRLRTRRDWEAFSRQEGIAFVARSPSYPAAIETLLTEMEAKGDLVPVAQVVVQDFQGKRIQGKRGEFPVVILRVNSFVGN